MHELARINVPAIVKKKRKKNRARGSSLRVAHSSHKICRCYAALVQVMQGITGIAFASRRIRRVWRERFPANRLATCHSLHD